MKKKYIYIIGIISLIGVLLGYKMYSALYAPNVTTDKKVYVDIPKQASFNELKDILNPYLNKKSCFVLASKIKRFSKPKPGRYQLTDKMSNNDLINQLRIGKQVEINVTFNNQNSLEDLATAISKQIAPTKEALLTVMKDQAFLNENGFDKETALLMYLPNTYRMYYNTSAKQFRSKMIQQFRHFWNSDRVHQAKEQNLSPLQVGVLASIIQKESTKESELPRIAGVYLNRLKANMLLQADPTVVYAYKQKYGKDLVIKRVLNKHKEVNSPYNTYKYAGLPPGPLAMPDMQSINAVLKPEQHKYYYFVADFNKPGYHIFSKNLSEHNRHANNYHSALNKNKIYH